MAELTSILVPYEVFHLFVVRVAKNQVHSDALLADRVVALMNNEPFVTAAAEMLWALWQPYNRAKNSGDTTQNELRAAEKSYQTEHSRAADEMAIKWPKGTAE